MPHKLRDIKWHSLATEKKNMKRNANYFKCNMKQPKRKTFSHK